LAWKRSSNPGVLPRLLRDRLHHPADGRTDRAEGAGAGGGPDAALIWFGVMLCVNMQTSFLHPPFGFALFYLRGVAPKEVKSSDIDWGAIPWIGLQAIMVAIVIAFPIVVTALLDKPLDVDLSKVRIEVPQIDLRPLDFGQPKQ
jgi:hypothetical protein